MTLPPGRETEIRERLGDLKYRLEMWRLKWLPYRVREFRGVRSGGLVWGPSRWLPPEIIKILARRRHAT